MSDRFGDREGLAAKHVDVIMDMRIQARDIFVQHKCLKIDTCALQISVALSDFFATALRNHENRLRPRLHR
jgi:hypothetical protein